MESKHENIVRNLVNNKFYGHLKQGKIEEAKGVISLAKQMNLDDLAQEFSVIISRYDQSDFQKENFQTG